MADPEFVFSSTPLSKRAARRLIQRAFVLAGRDRNVRQHIRSAEFTSFWVIEQWDVEWTLIFHQGRVDFERRPAKRPDIILTWHSPEQFFEEVESLLRGQSSAEFTGNLALRKFIGPVHQAFRAALKELLQNPVDEAGESLI